MVLGSHDLRVAERGVELYLQGWAPILIFSGGVGRLTKGHWKTSEADQFAKIAQNQGVPKSAILIENKSSNTGENFLLTQKLLNESDLNPQSFIVVHKPYMERRSYATFKKYFPEKKIVVTSPQLSFYDYPSKQITMDEVINIMVGDLQRIKLYSDNGFQIFQEIPDDVWQAFEKLVDLGYIDHLLQ